MKLLLLILVPLSLCSCKTTFSLGITDKEGQRADVGFSIDKELPATKGLAK